MLFIIIFNAFIYNVILFNIILNFRAIKPKDVLHVILYSLAIWGGLQLIPPNNYIEPMMGLTFLFTLVIRYIQKYNAINVIISACLTLIVVTFSDALTVVTVGALLSDDISGGALGASLKIYTIFTFILLVYGLLFSLILYQLKSKALRLIRNGSIQHLHIILTLAIAIISLTYYWLTYNMSNNGVSNHQILALSMVSILIFTVVSIYLFIRYHIKQAELRAKQRQLEENAIYTKEIEKNQLALRKYKHDYHNISLGLLEFIKQGDIDGVRNYYSQHFAHYEATNLSEDSGIDKLYLFEQEALKGLMWAKCIDALKKGIQLTIEIDAPIRYRADLCQVMTIVGIWFDNAIEACQDGDTIGIVVYEQVNQQYFIIDNPLHQALKMMQVKSANFSTKGRERGLGLSTVRQILADCPDFRNNTEIVDNHFKQTLVINVQNWSEPC